MTIEELRRLRARMCGHLLRPVEFPVVAEVGRDPSGAQRVVGEPNQPALPYATFLCQWLVLNPLASQQFAFTPGLRLDLRP
jgi:hypothetical protein